MIEENTQEIEGNIPEVEGNNDPNFPFIKITVRSLPVRIENKMYIINHLMI